MTKVNTMNGLVKIFVFNILGIPPRINIIDKWGPKVKC